MNEIYERQKTINLEYQNPVVVAGCGGIGYWTSLFLAMSGTTELHLYDPDNIELSNLNRLPVSINDIGKPKVEVLKQQILVLRPEIRIYAYHLKLSRYNLDLMSPSIILDCTDKYKSQVEISEFCEKNHIRYIRLGYNGGSHLTVADKVSKIFVDGAEPQDAYETVPSWIVPAVIVAGMGVMKALYRDAFRFRFAGEIKDIKT